MDPAVRHERLTHLLRRLLPCAEARALAATCAFAITDVLGELPWNVRADVLEFDFCTVDLAPLCARWDSGLDERSNRAILCGEIQHILMTEHELMVHWTPATSPRLPRVTSGAGAFLGDPDVWVVTYRARVGRAWESRLETYSSEAGADAVCDRLTRDPRAYRNVAKQASRLRH